jgi:mono/diheme cytochrome c family protein
MKKVVFGLLGLIILVVGGGLVFLTTMKPKQRPAPDWKVEPTPERLARGEYLATTVFLCLDCHSQLDFGRYGTPVVPGTEGQGGECFTKENAGFPGVVCAQNITPDKETGLGNWTDGEIARAIREGVNKNGEALFPMMPYKLMRNLSDEDTKSIVAYLRTLKPINHKIQQGKVDFPVNLFIKFEPQPVESVPEVDRKDSVAYGKYLSYACFECHTPVDNKMQRLPGKDFSGGREFHFKAVHVRTANLTPDTETGIGSWTKEQFVSRFAGWRAMAEMPKVEESQNTMMAWAQLRHLKDEDLGAIYDYLRTVPQVPNKVERRVAPEVPAAAPPAPATADAGTP